MAAAAEEEEGQLGRFVGNSGVHSRARREMEKNRAQLLLDMPAVQVLGMSSVRTSSCDLLRVLEFN